jgi:hypothetical protein
MDFFVAPNLDGRSLSEDRLIIRLHLEPEVGIAWDEHKQRSLTLPHAECAKANGLISIETYGTCSRDHPKAPRLFALKAQIDPGNRSRNRLWDKYNTRSRWRRGARPPNDPAAARLYHSAGCQRCAMPGTPHRVRSPAQPCIATTKRNCAPRIRERPDLPEISHVFLRNFTVCQRRYF